MRPFRPGSATALSAPYGRFEYRLLDHGRRMVIDHADPKVTISGDLVRQALAVGPHHTLAHSKLTIMGDNRKVIYLIGAYLPDIDCYEAEWPD